MLQIKDVYKRYKTGDYEQIALNGVSLSLRDNEFVAILGPSGSGKTTLLNIIGGLDHYDSGDLIINGVSTKKYKDRDWDTYRNHTIGFVFQSYNLIPHQTVLSNVELAMTLSGVSPAERKRRAREALEKVGLGQQTHKKPNQMSGGQMQRVAIARALVNEPDIILADEPTGALDSETSVQIMDILKEVAKDKLVVMVTHNPELAEQYATRIVRVKDGQIVADSNPVAADTALVEAGKQKWTRLAFTTALGLSLNNLLTKKGRTFLTAFAGAIGIIGIALILSLSNAVNDYINDIQNSMLSTNPIELTQVAYDLTSLMEARDTVAEDTMEEMNTEKANPDGQVYSNNIVGDSMTTTNSIIKTNDLGKFKVYLDSRLDEMKDSITAVEYTYDLSPLIYRKDGDEIKNVSPDSILTAGKSADTMSYSDYTANMISSPWQQLVENQDLREIQYELVAGEWPSSYDEAALILSTDNEVSDYTLYALGIMDNDRLQEMLDAIDAGEEYDDPVETFSYDDILGREYMVFAPYQMYEKSDADGADAEGKDTTDPVWLDKSDDEDYLASIYDQGIPVKITCILRATEDADISSGVAYDSELPLKLMDMAADSEIVKQQQANPEINVLTGKAFESDEEDEEDSASDKENSASAKGGASSAAAVQKTSGLSRTMEQISILTKAVSGKDASTNTASAESSSAAVNSSSPTNASAALTLSVPMSRVVSGDSGMITLAAVSDTGISEKDTSAADGSESFAENTGDSASGSGAVSDSDSVSDSGSDSTGSGSATSGSASGNTDSGSGSGSDSDSDSGSGSDSGSSSDSDSGSGSDSGEVIPDTEEYFIAFVDYDGTPLTSLLTVAPGTILAGTVSDPSRASTDTCEYIFVGWSSSSDHQLYTTAALPPATASTVYSARYYQYNYDGSEAETPELPDYDFSDIIDQLSKADLSKLLSNIKVSDLADLMNQIPGMDKVRDQLIQAVISSMSTEDLMKLMGIDSSSLMGNLSTEDLMKLMGIDASALTGSMSTEDLMKLMGIDMNSLMGNISEEDLMSMLGIDPDDLLGSLSDDDLALLMAQFSGSTPTTYDGVLSTLGYYTADDPTGISIYPVDLEGKDKIEQLISDYNDQVENDVDKVTYTDLIATFTSTLSTIVNTISYVLIAFVAISLIVSSIMIAIITYISVLERTKEIGVLRALGASKRDVSKIFNAETFIEGLISGLFGVGTTALLCIPITAIVNSLIEGELNVYLPPAAAGILVIISVILTLIAGFAPSRMAAKKDPVIALRSE